MSERLVRDSIVRDDGEYLLQSTCIAKDRDDSVVRYEGLVRVQYKIRGSIMTNEGLGRIQ